MSTVERESIYRALWDVCEQPMRWDTHAEIVQALDQLQTQLTASESERFTYFGNLNRALLSFDAIVVNADADSLSVMLRSFSEEMRAWPAHPLAAENTADVTVIRDSDPIWTYGLMDRDWESTILLPNSAGCVACDLIFGTSDAATAYLSEFDEEYEQWSQRVTDWVSKVQTVLSQVAWIGIPIHTEPGVVMCITSPLHPQLATLMLDSASSRNIAVKRLISDEG